MSEDRVRAQDVDRIRKLGFSPAERYRNCQKEIQPYIDLKVKLIRDVQIQIVILGKNLIKNELPPELKKVITHIDELIISIQNKYFPKGESDE